MKPVPETFRMFHSTEVGNIVMHLIGATHVTLNFRLLELRNPWLVKPECVQFSRRCNATVGENVHPTQTGHVGNLILATR